MQFSDAVISTNQSMAADFFSPQIATSQMHSITIQATWTGAPVGELFVQVSTDAPTNPTFMRAAVNWTECDGTQVDISGPGTFAWLDATARSFMRVGYRRTSGTGSINIQWMATAV